MEAANRGAFDVSAPSVGLNVDLPHEQYPNPYVTPELCLRFHCFAVRKLHFLLRAKAVVVFPGGYDTLDELFETLVLVQTRKIRPLPVALVGEAYWRRVFDADFLAAEGVIDDEDRELFWFAETAEEIWEGIRRWHALNGEPLAGPS
jgi:predicted Rossmann-fold nucleotide-binding protein